jgi:hypothetical protein
MLEYKIHTCDVVLFEFEGVVLIDCGSRKTVSTVRVWAALPLGCVRCS